MKIEPKYLDYNPSHWKEINPQISTTLQVFITNKCNLRCKACFYQHKLGKNEMSLEDYKKIILEYRPKIQKVILLGGEPTLHKDINKMIAFNTLVGLKTTIYTNGINLKVLENASLLRTTVRVGVYGIESSERPITRLPKTTLPITIAYMLRKDNIDELEAAALYAETNFNCKSLFISSIRDIEVTQDFWKDTDDTLSLEEYHSSVQKFLRSYAGSLKRIHISRRGIIKPYLVQKDPVTHCRFGNIFPDNQKIICPFDISRKIYTDKLHFNERKCNKCDECLLQKVVLENVESKPSNQKLLTAKKSRDSRPLPLAF